MVRIQGSSFLNGFYPLMDPWYRVGKPFCWENSFSGVTAHFHFLLLTWGVRAGTCVWSKTFYPEPLCKIWLNVFHVKSNFKGGHWNDFSTKNHQKLDFFRKFIKNGEYGAKHKKVKNSDFWWFFGEKSLQWPPLKLDFTWKTLSQILHKGSG